MKLNDDFMKHFRWLTPLLLMFSVFMLTQIFQEFKVIKQSVEDLKIENAVLKIMVKNLE